MKVIAHRGACSEALENSWDAFRKAVDCGAARIELDVHLTLDGHLAVVHDEDLQRTAGIKKRVADLSRSDIERSIKLFNGEPLPFLDEIFFELLPKIEINVEVKSYGAPTTLALAKLIQKQKHAHSVIVSSFSQHTVATFALDHPEIRTAFLWEKSLRLPFSFQWGPKNFMKKNSIRIFHPDARLVTPKIVEQIKLEGWEIYPYISLKNESNREELWSYLMTLGVDGLCTNYPREMLLWLQEATDDKKRFDNTALVDRIL